MKKCICKIKSLEEIEATLDEADEHHNLAWDDRMARYCGSVLMLEYCPASYDFNITYDLADVYGVWSFDLDWITVLSDCSKCLNRFVCYS